MGRLRGRVAAPGHRQQRRGLLLALELSRELICVSLGRWRRLQFHRSYQAANYFLQSLLEAGAESRQRARAQDAT
jgi:hypothetical protein